MINQIHFGDCREIMRKMKTAGVKVQTCVTSPPYYGLRDYGCELNEAYKPLQDDRIFKACGI